VWLDHPVPPRPACHELRAFGRTLAPQFGVQRLLARRAWRRRTWRAFSAGLSGCALSHWQAKPTTALDLEVRGFDVVQPAHAQGRQPTGVDQVAHGALSQAQHVTGAPDTGIPRQLRRYAFHV